MPNDPKGVNVSLRCVNMHQLRVTDTVPIVLSNQIAEPSKVNGATKGFKTFQR